MSQQIRLDKIKISFIAGILVAVLAVVCIAAYTPMPFTPLQQIERDKTFQFQMNGMWLPNVHPLHVGANNYTEVKNLRPNDTGYETVEGFTKINTTAQDPAVNMHFFKKGSGNTSESHVIAKINDSGTYYLWDNNATIPAQGDFQASSLYTVDSGLGSFANGPKGTMFYTDSTYDLVYGGDKMQARAFFVSNDANGATVKDYTDSVNNDSTASTAPIGSGGIDANTVLMLHCDGADASTTFTDDGATGHTVTANGDAQVDTAYYKFLTGSGLFDGTGDYLSIPDHNDFYFDGDFTIDFWFKINAMPGFGDAAVLFSQYVDSDNYVMGYLVDATTQQFVFQYRSAGTLEISTNAPSFSMSTGVWYHASVTRGYDGTSDSWLTQIYDSSSGMSRYNTEDDASAIANLVGSFYIGGQASYPGGAIGFEAFNGAVDEFRISNGVARYNGSFTPASSEYTGGSRYFFVLSPLKLDGITPYIDGANTDTVTLAGAVWTGSSYDSLTLTDGTDSGGVSFAQTGDITWTYTDDARVKYFNGNALYVYRFDLNGGTATIYSLTMSAPLQPIRDVWNSSKRTCIAFQAVRSGAYEDYTFQVIGKDSSSGSIYAATIGGIGSSDELILLFEDRTMAIDFGMYAGKVNAADAQINSVSYWDGDSYESVGWFEDGTLNDDGNVSFFKSGVLTWTSPSEGSEHPQELFGVEGYAYKITVDGTLTTGTGYDGTSVDFVGGIPAPLSMTGYDLVSAYNGRVFLINGSVAEFSQSDTPWVFNGVDASDKTRRSIQFGDDTPIVAATTLFNRYGSSLIETFVVLKSNSTYIMSGSQPYVAYEEPFVKKTVSTNIGCAAPMTLNSYDMEVGSGLRMGVAVWLDFAGPVVFNGAVPTRIPGIENFFDPTSSTYVNYSYINKSFGYIDSINDEWNLLFPTGDSTTCNKWVVYSFRHKKWYEKKVNTQDVVLWDVSGDAVLWDASGDSVIWDSGVFPQAGTYVTDSNGARYNYGFLTTGYMMRLDNGSTWDGAEIAQQIRTGIFSPGMIDDLGLWTTSKIRGLRLISEAISEDRDVLGSILIDGTLSDNSIQIALDSSKAVSRNLRAKNNLAEKGEYFQVDFTTITSVDKWSPLSWGYRAQETRED